MTFDPSFLSDFLLILTAWGGAFLAALWLSLIVWTYRDIRARAKDPLGRILAVLIVAVLFLPGIVIYLILSPISTLEDEYQHTLEEEALLQSIEDKPVCPGCGRQTKDPWKICPNCHTRLKKTCHQCGKLMDLPWNLCPFCGTPTPGKRRENITINDALEPLAGLSFDEIEPEDDLIEIEKDEVSQDSDLDFDTDGMDNLAENDHNE